MTACPEISSRIDAARHAVMAQTDLLHREFGQVTSQWKSDGTRVTAADIAISENIFRELESQFKEDQYFSEELLQADTPIAVTSRFSWVLDPIDGTNNFAKGIPHCAIGLALLEEGMPIYGFVYDFGRKTLMHGGPGHGLWDGDKQVQLNSKPLEPESVIGFHTPYDKSYAAHAAILVKHFKLRALGTSTMHLAYVANGLFDGVVDHNVKVWDIASAVPLVEAVGGVIAFITPSPFPLREFDLKMKRIFYVAGSPAAITELRRVLGI